MDLYQQYIHKSRYARYLPNEQRRETWEETIDRYLNFWIEKQKITLEEANDMFKDIHDLDVMPSMRALICLLYTSPSPRDGLLSRMPSSA